MVVSLEHGQDQAGVRGVQAGGPGGPVYPSVNNAVGYKGGLTCAYSPLNTHPPAAASVGTPRPAPGC